MSGADPVGRSGIQGQGIVDHDDGLASGESFQVDEVQQRLLEQMQSVDEGQGEIRSPRTSSQIVIGEETVTGHGKEASVGRKQRPPGRFGIDANAPSLRKGGAQGIAMADSDLHVGSGLEDLMDPAQDGVVIGAGQRRGGLRKMNIAEGVIVVEVSGTSFYYIGPLRGDQTWHEGSASDSHAYEYRFATLVR